MQPKYLVSGNNQLPLNEITYYWLKLFFSHVVLWQCQLQREWPGKEERSWERV